MSYGDPPTTGGLLNLSQEASTVVNITAMSDETDYLIENIQQKEDWLADISKSSGTRQSKVFLQRYVRRVAK